MNNVSVVIAWRQRPEIEHTLRANARFFRKHDAEVVVANCGGDPGQAASLLAGCELRRLRHVVMPDAVFNKPLANNIGALSTSGDLLFFLDADIVLDSDVIAAARPRLARRRCVVKIRTVHESRPMIDPRMRCVQASIETHDTIFTNGRKVRLRFYRGGDGSRCGSGLLLMHRDDFLAVGGFNSALTGWGFEDKDLQVRLQLARELTVSATGRATHLTHGDDVRDIRGRSSEEDNHRNVLACFENYSQGNYRGTYEDDARHWRDRLHEPSPVA